jgi:hypothetical protein
MEPTLDETSLVPCPTWTPAARVSALAAVLREFDQVGFPRALRSVANAADRDIAQGRGLRSWCFDRELSRDAGRLVALRLSQQPFIDGPEGLMALAEGRRVLETQVDGAATFGLGLGALEDRPVATLASAIAPIGRQRQVEVIDASTDPLTTTMVSVFAYALGDDVIANAEALQAQVDSAIGNGQVLLARLGEVFPRLRLGVRASESIQGLTGNEPVFPQLIRHLRALNAAADKWVAGAAFLPEGITFSPESEATLRNGKYGPMRDFPAPEGFEQQRWSLHTKLTGGAGARMYFRPVRPQAAPVAVLIGYIGGHLPCVRYP